MAAGGIHGRHYSHSKECPDLSDSLLPCHVCGGPRYHGIRPPAANEVLGQGRLRMGPRCVLLAQPGKWTIVNLVSNVWSVAGSGSRPSVNQMLDQYVIAYQLNKGWYVNSAPIITADWRARSGSVWTLPFGGGIGRVQKLGPQPGNLQGGVYGNPIYSKGGSSWSKRLKPSFLFPHPPAV